MAEGLPAPDLLPQVRSMEWVEAQGRFGDSALVYRKLNEQLATVYVMPLGGNDVKPVIEALTRNKKYIRAEVAHTLNLRYAPDLRFREDETFEEATRIDRLLDSERVQRDIKK